MAAPTPEELQRKLEQLERQSEQTLRNLAGEIAGAFESALTGASSQMDTTTSKAVRNLSNIKDIQEKVKDNAKKIAQFSSSTRDIENQIIKAAQMRAEEISKANDKYAKYEGLRVINVNKITKAYAEQMSELREQLRIQEAVEGAMNNLLGPFKALSKLPFVGQLINTNRALEKMKFELKAGSSRVDILKAGFKELAKGAMAAAGPLVFAAAIKGAIELDSKLTEVTRSMGLSREQALGLYENLAAAGNASDNLRNNATRLIEVTGTLNKLRGTAVQFSEDDLMAINEALTSKLLEAEAAGNLFRMQNMQNESVRAGKLEMIGAGKAIEAERKMRLDLGVAMNDALKTTGQIRANIGANPEALMRATTLAKSFGMELSDVKSISQGLLNFESSIGKELEAELLLGRQLNLERARLYALTGDYEGLMREVNSQVGDFHDFSKLNVLQQQALAQSMGLSADQLSDMLFKEADLETLKEKARAENDEDTLKMYERLSLQEEFNLAMMRLKELFVESIGPSIISFVEFLQKASMGANNLKTILRVGIIGAFTLMGAQMGLRIAQMSILNALAATQLGLTASTATAATGPLAPATAALIGGGIAAVLGIISSFALLAKGGTVFPGGDKMFGGGTPAIIGEGGQPETVIPLDKSPVVANQMARELVKLGVVGNQPGPTIATQPNDEKQPINLKVSVIQNQFDKQDPVDGSDAIDETYASEFITSPVGA